MPLFEVDALIEKLLTVQLNEELQKSVDFGVGVGVPAARDRAVFVRSVLQVYVRIIFVTM